MSNINLRCHPNWSCVCSYNCFPVDLLYRNEKDWKWNPQFTERSSMDIRSGFHNLTHVLLGAPLPFPLL